MQVKVKLFASLAKYAQHGQSDTLPGTPFLLELPAGATLADLALALHMPAEEVKIAFINAVTHPLETTLKDGDEVGFFPPIGGGAHG
jgi:molybdopterin converting factor small subunit